MRKTFLPTISMNNPISDYFNSFDSVFNFDYPTASRRSTMNIPRVNILKTDFGHTIEMAAPGYARDDFNLGVDAGGLTVSVTSEDGKDYKQNLQVREYSLESWTRSWVLPEGANVDQVSARYDAGILYVEIPSETKMDNIRSITVE